MPSPRSGFIKTPQGNSTQSISHTTLPNFYSKKSLSHPQNGIPDSFLDKAKAQKKSSAMEVFISDESGDNAASIAVIYLKFIEGFW